MRNTNYNYWREKEEKDIDKKGYCVSKANDGIRELFSYIMKEGTSKDGNRKLKRKNLV